MIGVRLERLLHIIETKSAKFSLKVIITHFDVIGLFSIFFLNDVGMRQKRGQLVLGIY